MAGFVQPIIQGMQVLKEHQQAAQQAQAEQAQRELSLQQAIVQMVMQRMQEGGNY